MIETMEINTTWVKLLSGAETPSFKSGENSFSFLRTEERGIYLKITSVGTATNPPPLPKPGLVILLLLPSLHLILLSRII